MSRPFLLMPNFGDSIKAKFAELTFWAVGWIVSLYCLLLLWTYHHDRAVSVPHNGIGDAPHQGPSDPPPPLLPITMSPAPISSANPTISCGTPPSTKCACASVTPNERSFSTSASSSSLARCSELRCRSSSSTGSSSSAPPKPKPSG